MISVSRAGVGTSVTTTELADDSVTAVKIAEAAKAELTGPYRSVFNAGLVLPATQAAATLLLGGSNDVTAVASGGDAAPNAMFPTYRLVAADHAITGLSTRFKLVGVVGVNATDSGTSDFTFNLRPATVAGAADVLAITGGASAIATSTLAAATLTTSEFEFVESADTAPPADGAYVMTCTTTAALAASSAVYVWAHLLIHHVV